MDTKQKLLDFLKSQKFLVIASHDGELWISNVFYGIDDDFTIYFVSGEGERHSKQILESPNVAFSTVWYDDQDHTNRKGVQGVGQCFLAEDDREIETGTKLHNENFPEFAHRIGLEYIKSDKNQAAVWTINPSYIKYWDDELYGDDQTEEFSL